MDDVVRRLRQHLEPVVVSGEPDVGPVAVQDAGGPVAVVARDQRDVPRLERGEVGGHAGDVTPERQVHEAPAVRHIRETLHEVVHPASQVAVGEDLAVLGDERGSGGAVGVEGTRQRGPDGRTAGEPRACGRRPHDR